MNPKVLQRKHQLRKDFPALRDILPRLDRIEALLKDLSGLSTKPLTLAEAAEYLDASKSHLYQLTCKSQIAHYKPNGKKIFFDKRDLDEYLLRNRRVAHTETEREAADYVETHPLSGVGR
ncbi:MAG: helix-turn-helix domain-containing protein [Terriglobia bacterium]